MKKIILFILPVFILSCNQNNKTIEGNLSNQKEATTLYLEELFPEIDPIFIDSCKVEDGKFSFDVKQENIGIYKLYHTPNNFAILIVKNGDQIKLDMDLNNLAIYYGNGSIEIEGYVRILNIFNDTKLSEDSLRMIYQKAEGTADQQMVMERVMIRYNELMFLQQEKIKEYIVNNSNNFATVLALINLGSIEENFDLYKNTSDSLDKYYPLNNWTSNIKEELKTRKSTSVGAIAPDFTINDTNGKAVSLSSFRGKHVLIDFWASWCKPCRDANPNLVRLYDQYKSQGFEIIGVSLDDTTKSTNEKAKWLNAIKDDNIRWTQLSDLIGADSETAKTYGVKSIPSTFLIDGNGYIIAKDLKGTLLNKKLSEIFE
jgi:peroxiredoxin